jgi:hypothetical protein
VCRRWAADRQSDFSTVLVAVEMGLRAVLDRESVGYYSNIDDEKREFERKVRTVVRGIAVLAANVRLLNPLRHGLFAWQLASHKCCRWLVPFAMILAGVSNTVLVSQSPLYFAALLLQVGLYTAAVGGLYSGAPFLRIPAFLVRANLAVLVAWFRYARGERITSWNPSARMAVFPRAILAGYEADGAREWRRPV